MDSIAKLMLSFLLSKGLAPLCLSVQHPGNVDVDADADVEELSSRTRMKLRLMPPIRAVLQLATLGAVLRETARLPPAATVIPPATTSTPAVMTSPQLAATVRTQW